jgi:NADPH:quinone reductase-like Zn-dependent oxidoreductase
VKAILLPGSRRGLEALAVVEREIVRPRGTEVLVKVHASSLNFHDYAVVVGTIPTSSDRIPMSDAAGEVIEVGDEVTEFKVGDRVISTFFPDWPDGEATPANTQAVPGDTIDGFAVEYATALWSAFTRAPAGYTHTEAATLPCAALTAWRALFVDGQLRPGEIVLTQGTGGVSLFALQFAKAAGATVIATSSSDEKLARLRQLGADHLINYRAQEKWGAAAKALTGGRGVDHVIETGGAGTFPQSMAACRMGGHISVIGVLTGVSGVVTTAMIMRKQLRVVGLAVGSRRQQLDMLRALEVNRIRPVIDSVFALERLGEAFRRQESGQQFGKIVIQT